MDTTQERPPTVGVVREYEELTPQEGIALTWNGLVNSNTVPLVTGRGLRRPHGDFWRMAPAARAKPTHEIKHQGLLALLNGEVRIVNRWNDILELPRDTTLLCIWPGEWSSDWFIFTAAEAIEYKDGLG